MEHLTISELERTVNPLTGHTHIVIRVSVKPPDKIEIGIGNSYHLFTNAITFTVIQRSKQEQAPHR